jgi:hypothetical protein
VNFVNFLLSLAIELYCLRRDQLVQQALVRAAVQPCYRLFFKPSSRLADNVQWPPFFVLHVSFFSSSVFSAQTTNRKAKAQSNVFGRSLRSAGKG